MPPKTNKIIVLISLIIVLALIVFAAINKDRLKISKKLEVSTGEIKGIISGTSYDAMILDNIYLSNIGLVLKSQDDSNLIFQTTVSTDGSFVFSNVPSGQNYFLETDNSKPPASYYFPYKVQVSFPYKEKSINWPIKLTLTEAASRDIQRQKSLFLYENLLELYKTDHGHYPVGMGDEKILNTNAHIISALTSYLKKINFDSKNLIDPLKDRPFIYRSGGVHYWVNAYPEVITEVSLFDKTDSYGYANTYLIHK